MKAVQRNAIRTDQLNKLIANLIDEAESYKRQRDELIADMQVVKLKAVAWDKLKRHLRSLWIV